MDAGQRPAAMTLVPSRPGWTLAITALKAVTTSRSVSSTSAPAERAVFSMASIPLLRSILAASAGLLPNVPFKVMSSRYCLICGVTAIVSESDSKVFEGRAIQ